jgi:tape measure domain-containing protein
LDQASFVAALIDKVSGPARKMKGQLSSLNKAFRDVTKGAQGRDEMGKFMKRSGGMLKSMEGAFRGAGKSLGSAVQSGVEKLKEGLLIGGLVAAGVAASIGAATIKVADFAQTTRIGFQSVAKHGASAEKLFTHFRGLAEGLGLDVMDTNKQAVKLMALQFSPKMAENLIKMGADMRALGADAEGVDRIFAQLGQIKAKGRLQGEELTVLAENGLSTQLVYEALGKQLGKTQDEILKMQQAGKLTSDMAFPAIMEAVLKKTGSKELGQAGKRVADETLSGMAGQLKAKAQNALIDIATQATPAIVGAFKPISDELGALFKNKSVQEGLIVAFEAVGNVVREAVPFVKEFVGSLGAGFMEAWPAMKGAMGVLFDGFGGKQDWMGTIKELGKSLGQIAALGVTVATVFGGMLVAGIQMVSAAVQIAGYMWEGLIKGIGSTLFAIDDFFSNVAAKWRAFDFGALATSLIDGLVNGIRNGIASVVGAVGELGQATVSGLKNVLGIHSPSKEFEYLGQMSGLGFSQGLEGSLPANNNGFGPTLSSFTGAPSIAGVGGSGFGDINVTVYVENHFSGGNSEEHARAFEHSLETRLGGVLERLAAQAAA